MKKKKYDRPFVEVLMLETTRGMMDNVSIDPDNALEKDPNKPRSMKRPSGSSAWEDDSEIMDDDMGFKAYD